MDARCKNCRFWNLSHWGVSPNVVLLVGICENPRLIKGYGKVTPESYRPDFAWVEDDEGWAFQTGPDFGCVHFEEKL